MDLVRTFQADTVTKSVTILGTREEPLFKASDIADILGINNVRAVTADWDSSEKHVTAIDTLGGKQSVTFLTEDGLYRLIFRSNKPIAERFRKWVVSVMKEIRLTGKYELPEDIKERLSQSEAKTAELEQQLLEVSQQKETLEKEMNTMRNMDGQPIIYIYDTDTRIPLSNKPRVLKIGVTEHYQKRFKPYKQVTPFGRMVFYVRCQTENLRLTENWINHLFKPFNQAGEVFEMSLDLAKKWLVHIENTLELSRNLNFVEMESQLSRIVDSENIILNKTELVSAAIVDSSTQTDNDVFEQEDKEVEISITKSQNEERMRFDKYIDECCLLDPLYEVPASDIVGQYRLWARSADKQTFHALNDYLQTRFRYVRLPTTKKTTVVNGFRGVKLKELPNELLPFGASDPELFIAHACTFSPSNKVLMADLLKEYEQWCKNVGKLYNKQEFKKHLRDSPRVLVANVWTSNGNGQGYYGLCLKNDEANANRTSSTAKHVTKRTENGDIICTWTTIAKAAHDESISSAKLSRAIKNKTIINGFIYVSS